MPKILSKSARIEFVFNFAQPAKVLSRPPTPVRLSADVEMLFEGGAVAQIFLHAHVVIERQRVSGM